MISVIQMIDLWVCRGKELSNYINMEIARDVDLMECWQENRTVLPQLFKVACRVLCVSSSASERL